MSTGDGAAGRAGASRRAELSLLAITAVWGLTFVTVQDAVELMPVSSFLGYRFIAAALLLAIVFRRRLSGLNARGLWQGIVMGVLLTAGYLFQTYGLEATSASKAGFITGLFVVITPLLARCFGGPAIGRVAWLAAAVSALGLYLMSGGVEGFTFRGDGLELLCAVAFSGHIVATGWAVSEGHDVAALVVVQLAVTGFVCTAIAAFAGQLVVPHGAGLWTALVLTSVVASSLAFMVQSWAQREADPARTALILAGEPAFAGFFGWWLAGDTMGLMGWFGAALILGAIVAVDAVPRLRPPRPLPEG